MKLSFWKREAECSYELDPAYQDLRSQVFKLDPKKLGLEDSNPNDIWAVVTEMGLPTAVVTLIAMGDGNSSLYYSTGGGIIGAGQNPGPARAARALVFEASQYAPDCECCRAQPLPAPGNIRFHLLTFNGVLSLEASESDLRENRHRLSPLFHAAHELVTEIRLLDEGKNMPVA